MSKVTQVVKVIQSLGAGGPNSLRISSEIADVIKSKISDVHKADVGFHPSLISNDAPVTYISIYDDRQQVSASIFALRPESRLPIHDHPGMYGFIKCIHGSISISSFTKSSDYHEKPEHEHTDSGTHIPDIVRAIKEPRHLLHESTGQTVMLEPVKGNVHSIQAVDGPAAFLDFLLPPYCLPSRPCHYYDFEKELDSGSVLLREVDCPIWYWCDSVPYNPD